MNNLTRKLSNFCFDEARYFMYRPGLLMRFSGMSCRCGGWLAALAVGAFGLAAAHAGGHGEKIEFSEPSTPVIASNLTSAVSPGLDRLNPTPNRFKQVQDELFGPLKDAIANDSMQPLISLPPQNQQQSRSASSRRSKKLMDEEKNWAFTDLNDLYPEPTIEETLGLKDAEPDAKKDSSLIQRYYDRDGQNAGANRGFQPRQTPDGKLDFTGTPSFDPLVAQIPGHEAVFTKKMFGMSDDSNSGKIAGGYSDAGNLQTVSDEELSAAKRHREEFSHLLDPSLPQSKPASGLFADPAAVNFQSPLFSQDNDTAAQPAQAAQPYRSILNQAGITDPTIAALHSAVYDDPTAAALGMPNPTPVRTVPPPVTAESIQKMLDPFSANLPKRKF
jgi:hypothetical protein